MERHLHPWEGVQRQGQDIADQFGSLAQGLGHALQSHVFVGIPFIRGDAASGRQSDAAKLCAEAESEVQYKSAQWGWNCPCPQPGGQSSRCDRVGFERGFKLEEAERVENATQSFALHELGSRLGQAGAELGASIHGFVGHVIRHLPNPFHSAAEPEPKVRGAALDVVCRSTSSPIPERKQVTAGGRRAQGVGRGNDVDHVSHYHGELLDLSQDELFAMAAKSHGQLHKQSSVAVTTTYDSRTQDIESSIVARGDLWRAEASHGGSSSSNGNSSPLFLLQVGPILFVRDTTLLIPVHLSKQHLLWYGFDRKNSQHSLCPAIWSKHRRWLMMSMISLNPISCSFMDFQFPNGHMTYVAGEGLMGSAFLPTLGGLVQVQGRYPGNTKLSYSYRNRWGTRKTLSLRLPDKSASFNVTQPLLWQRSGMMYRPTIQLSLTSTLRDQNEGWKGEVIHSPKEKLSWGCGFSYATELQSFATVSLGRSKRNGEHTGSSGLVFQVQAPFQNLRRASFSVQLNSGVEF